MSTLSNGTWDERLMCNAVSLSYDFCNFTGQLHLPDGHCCDMTGCVTMFEGIDPKVTAIHTYSGGTSDTICRKMGAEWRALMPSKA